MKINELRDLTGMSQSKFATYFGISVRNIQEWEQERKQPPPYNTRFTQEQILQVKHVLFLDKHVLGDGEEPKYFDPCFEIAESWRRLMGQKKDIQKHDITLINHELTEMELICKGYSQADAHNITNKKYNYTEESDNYYHELRLKISPKEINGGGIRRLLSHRTH